MSRNIIGLAVLLGLAIFAYTNSRGGFFNLSDERSAKKLAAAAAQLNKELPKTVDEVTEFTRVEGLQGTLVYHYTITRGTAADYDAAAMTSTLKPLVTRQVCSTPQTRDTLLKNGVTMRYAYADKSGQAIASFDIQQADCRAP